MSGIELDWQPEKFKAALRERLVANGAIVGKYVETEARRRLLALDDIRVELPGRKPYYGGAAYRAYVAGLLGYEVESLPDEVVIRVGVRAGKSGTRHGLYIELGTQAFAPRPYLRPAVLENKGRILALLRGE